MRQIKFLSKQTLFSDREKKQQLINSIQQLRNQTRNITTESESLIRLLENALDGGLISFNRSEDIECFFVESILTNRQTLVPQFSLNNSLYHTQTHQPIRVHS